VNTIKALIVDDEPLARKGVRQLLTDHTDVAIVGEAATGKEAIRMIKKLCPDLVFLDVQMPEIDGFAVLRDLDALDKFAVIFVTAHDEYAVRAFEEHALDYLLEPLNEGRFTDALNRTRTALTSKQAMDIGSGTRFLANSGHSGSPFWRNWGRRISAAAIQEVIGILHALRMCLPLTHGKYVTRNAVKAPPSTNAGIHLSDPMASVAGW
jgi:CheY-like chemotaxis protein